MLRLNTCVEIAAPAALVWRILVDFPRYSEWNPLVPRAAGEARAGGILRVVIQPPGLRPAAYRLLLLKVEPERALCWLGRLFAPKIMDGDHLFLLEPLSKGRMRLIQRETFSGLLVPLMAPWLKGNMREGFEALNRALKARAEAAAERLASSDPRYGSAPAWGLARPE